MSFPPSCFLIGAQKAGTTTLAELLDAQPDICLSAPKESMFFSKNYNRGMDWYRDCFANPQAKVLLDASPDYSRVPTALFPAETSYDGDVFEPVPRRIHHSNPNARFLYVLRNPVSRTHSSYWHNIRAGYEDSGSFSEMIRSSDRYLVASDYLGQIAAYQRFFAAQQFHFILFEKLVKAPQAEVEACCRFLGLEYAVQEAATEPHKNASYQLSGLGRLIQNLSGTSSNFKRASDAAKKVIPGSLQSIAKRMVTSEIPKISAADEHYLKELFQGSYAQLEQITGLDLSGWR